MTLRYAVRVLKRNLLVFNRLYKMNLAINFVEPTLYLFAFGIGLGAFVSDIGGMSYIQYIAPGMVCYSALFAAAFECLYDTYIRMEHQKTFNAILATPVNPEGVILGEIFYAAFKAIVFGSIIMIVVYVAGLIPTPWLPFSLPFVFMGAVSMASMSMFVTASVKGMETFNYYVTMVVSPLMLFSGVYFPLSGWLATVAQFSPFYHTAKVCQLLAAGNISGIWLHGAVLFVMMAITLSLGIWKMKRRLMR